MGQSNTILNGKKGFLVEGENVTDAQAEHLQSLGKFTSVFQRCSVPAEFPD